MSLEKRITYALMGIIFLLWLFSSGVHAGILAAEHDRAGCFKELAWAAVSFVLLLGWYVGLMSNFQLPKKER